MATGPWRQAPANQAVGVLPFQMERLGIIMRAQPDNPWEAWGVLNPGGTRGPEGAYHLFPRLVAEGNFSRIGRGTVVFDQGGDPVAVERRGWAIEPREPYELTAAGGGVEDPRVTYVQPLQRYVMTYTAYTPGHPRVALSISSDLLHWTRLGLLHFASEPGVPDLNADAIANKDALVFPEAVPDPHGRPAVAIIHRPTLPRILPHDTERGGIAAERQLPAESIWISYVPLGTAQADIHRLTTVHDHRVLLAPRAGWESLKVGGGAPPVRLPYGWLLIYHGVSADLHNGEIRCRYSAGAAILSLDDPTHVLYRSADAILEPELPEELQGTVPEVVFPTATDLRAGNRLDVYYGAADSAIGVARLTIPPTLPLWTARQAAGTASDDGQRAVRARDQDRGAAP